MNSQLTNAQIGMAYAAGYTSHGQFSAIRNDYKVQIKHVSDSDSEEATR